jgi:hypothetical protein
MPDPAPAERVTTRRNGRGSEVARIKAAIETWHSYGAAADRRWLEPLIELIFSPEAKL